MRSRIKPRNPSMQRPKSRDFSMGKSNCR
jgi:hypothetical protein